jgi:hypothetical protein
MRKTNADETVEIYHIWKKNATSIPYYKSLKLAQLFTNKSNFNSPNLKSFHFGI